MFWDAGTGKRLRNFTVVSGTAFAMAISPDGKTIAVGTAQGGLLLLNSETGAVLRTHDVGNQVDSLAWAPDGSSFAVGTSEGKVQIRSPDGATVLRTILAHRRSVAALTWSPDSKTLATLSYEAVRLWEVATGKPVAVALPLSEGRSVVFSPEGHYRGTPLRLNRELVYVVQTNQGQETYTQEEFEQKFGRTNGPAKVRMEAR